MLLLRTGQPAVRKLHAAPFHILRFFYVICISECIVKGYKRIKRQDRIEGGQMRACAPGGKF